MFLRFSVLGLVSFALSTLRKNDNKRRAEKLCADDREIRYEKKRHPSHRHFFNIIRARRIVAQIRVEVVTGEEINIFF